MMKRFFLLAVVATASILVFAQTPTVTHIVQRGETIESIAKYYHVSVEDINKANPNAEGMVYVGMKLVVPQKKLENSITSKNDTQVESHESVTSKPIPAKGNVDNSNSSEMKVSDNPYVVGEGSSFSFLYQSEAKVYGFQMELGTKTFCMVASVLSNLKFDKKETLSSLGYLGTGVRRKLVFNNVFVLQGKIYPYIGFTQTDTPKNVEIGQEGEDKLKFTYGASADLSVGVKLWNTPSGNSTFLHVGYAVMAGEFKTKGMFKYGNIIVGLTTILK